MYKSVIVKLQLNLFFFILIQSEVLSSNLILLTCKNTENDSIHKFKIFLNYKVVNILPNGYEFNYLIEKESSEEVKAYFYQKELNLVKKFTLSFNLKDNILYDEMYEGKDINNLKLKDRKFFMCKK
ncbi:MAG: hypothetical protein HN613_05705 [Gammaproteobacteria bacterium]|jgi:hypothetical protein|nr:hypothetical protein [Gammaproteobacteria bacterium]MBT7603947.1 hypothetical protein [Gammaproteobacteria bacterium]